MTDRCPALVDAATKTGNQRVVRLDERTVQAIETLRRERERYGPWMLQPGERPLNPERLTAWWRLARRDARIETRWRLHDVRHWSATEAIGRGHDIRTVAGRLGHANPAMTCAPTPTPWKAPTPAWRPPWRMLWRTRMTGEPIESYLRSEEPPNDAVVVVRGAPVAPEKIVEHAQRQAREYTSATSGVRDINHGARLRRESARLRLSHR